MEKKTRIIKNIIVVIFCLLIPSLICLALQSATTNDTHVPLIFVLAVFVISLKTDGYIYGVIASFFSVFFVNWAFSYPYFSLDFSIYGYPITFITMLTVSVITSTLMSRYKKRGEEIRRSEAEKMRANLLRSVSHDLRTPLTIIIGDSEIVLENEENQENKKLLVDIKENADWLVRMVENILSITKMNGTYGEIQKTNEIPEEIIGGIISKFNKKHSNIEFNTKFPDEVFFIPMDCLLIEQLFMNLFDNSLIHGKCTAISIKLSKNDNYATFEVSDNGVGIDQNIVKYLFDDDFQSSNETTADSNKFMGIGLAVCKTIVKAHGGEIKAIPCDTGAKFIFTLRL